MNKITYHREIDINEKNKSNGIKEARKDIESAKSYTRKTTVYYKNKLLGIFRKMIKLEIVL